MTNHPNRSKMPKVTLAQAERMADAFAKMGAVSRATSAEIRSAMMLLSDAGDHTRVNLLISEECRRHDAIKALSAAIAIR
jgi:hypothetical protein